MPIAQSSHLQSYDYDEENQTLTVQFVNGAIYTYASVPQHVAWELQESGGAGTYFHAKIRNRYPTSKVLDPSGV